MSYPERRPYATTVNHSGYCAKPQPLTPKPPTDALRILAAQIGYDQPRSSRPKTSTNSAGSISGGRLAALVPSLAEKSDLDAQKALADPTLFPNAERRPQEALAAAKLEAPFQHAASTYHSSQQSILNAELRLRVENFLDNWLTKVRQLNELVGHYPTDGATVNYSVTEAIKSYLDAYRSTEDLHVPAQRLIQDRCLNTGVDELNEIESVAVVPLDNIRRSLDSLLTSAYPLAPLDQYQHALRILDTIASGLPEDVRAGHSDDDAEAGLICPSSTAVVLHEKLHYHPGAYAMSELKKSEDPLLEMERRVADARARKEAAIDATNPVDALRSLHAQVDFCNDLLLMNKARMDLVRLHSEDVRELRAAVAAVLVDAKQAVELLEMRVRGLQPRLQQDVETIAGDMAQSRQTLEALEAKEAEAEEAMRREMRERDDAEKVLWEQMRAIMRQLTASAEMKAQIAAQHLSLREKRAKEHLAVKELLKAQTAHHERLTQCEELVQRWGQGAGVYGKFVDAFVPKLLKRVNQLEDDDEDLSNREAQDYVRRFEMFAYAAEEVRAKRAVQADRMRLMQRSSLLDRAAANETLDPKGDDHLRRYDEAGRELEEVTAYMAYIRDIEEDRRAEVEPVLRRVLAYNMAVQREVAAAQDSPNRPVPAIEVGRNCITTAAGADAANAATPEKDAEERDSVNASVQMASEDGHSASDAHATAEEEGEEAAVRGGVVRPAAAAANDGTVEEYEEELAPVPLTATVAHPYVTASKIALAHEEAYVEKHRELNNAELAAQEEKVAGIRRTKAELAALANRYQNADYIRELLLGSDQAAAPKEKL